MSDLYATAARYGVRYTGELVDDSYHDQVERGTDWSLREVADAGGKITRLRILAERGYGDVSYIHATLPDGRIVRVRQDFDCHSMPMRALKGILIGWAKDQGVFAKGVGLLDSANYAILY